MNRINLAFVLSVVLLLASGAVWAAEPIASASTNWAGITVDLMAVERKGNILTVKWAVRNGGSDSQGVIFQLTGNQISTYVVDEENGTKYYVLTDKEGHALASEHEWTGSSYGVNEYVQPGETKRFWMKLPAPPPEVKTVSIFFTQTEPFEEVPITDK